ncbi:amidohydrolase [Halomicroarcula sp. GCM10025817]|uniref:amidohydrolase n=1 Tax=Haloarcula TaxID=2237 RepID=UPI0023E7D69F|nr:amidohydrolase [Halomicroarcula sp. SYNS111]
MVIIRNGLVHTQTERGTVEADLCFRDGEIVSVGDIEARADETVLDADGAHVTPGLVDAHSHVGLSEWGEPEDYDINELTEPVTPHVSALDGFHPGDEELAKACQGGVTTVSARMGSANVVGGITCSMKTHGETADEMLVREDGMKAAMGENPKRIHGEENDRQPSTRPGVAAMLRSTLMKAEDYVARKEHARDEGDAFERDLGMENLSRVLDGDLALRVHAHRADDIRSVFRIADEFDVTNLSIEHATEGHRIAGEFVSRGVPAVVGPSFVSATKYELRNISFETPAKLHDAGVAVAIQTDAPVLPQQYLDVCVGLAVREGLPSEAALDTVTTTPATLLGIDDRVGTLEPGTDADLVVWDGPFYRLQTNPEHVFVDGKQVHGEAL